MSRSISSRPASSGLGHALPTPAVMPPFHPAERSSAEDTVKPGWYMRTSAESISPGASGMHGSVAAAPGSWPFQKSVSTSWWWPEILKSQWHGTMMTSKGLKVLSTSCLKSRWRELLRMCALCSCSLSKRIGRRRERHADADKTPSCSFCRHAHQVVHVRARHTHVQGARHRHEREIGEEMGQSGKWREKSDPCMQSVECSPSRRIRSF